MDPTNNDQFNTNFNQPPVIDFDASTHPIFQQFPPEMEPMMEDQFDSDFITQQMIDVAESISQFLPPFTDNTFPPAMDDGVQNGQFNTSFNSPPVINVDASIASFSQNTPVIGSDFSIPPFPQNTYHPPPSMDPNDHFSTSFNQPQVFDVGSSIFNNNTYPSPEMVVTQNHQFDTNFTPLPLIEYYDAASCNPYGATSLCPTPINHHDQQQLQLQQQNQIQPEQRHQEQEEERQQQLKIQQKQKRDDEFKMFWAEQCREIVNGNEYLSKIYKFPLARIRKIMKADEDVNMVSTDALVLFDCACEMFILHLTYLTRQYVEEKNRRLMKREDFGTTIAGYETFDFLVNTVQWSSSQ